MLKSFLKISLAAFLVIFGLNIGRIAGTNSSFVDTETSAGNSFTAGTWNQSHLMVQTENILAPSPDVSAEDPAAQTPDAPSAVSATDPALPAVPPEDIPLPENSMPDAPVVVPDETAVSNDATGDVQANNPSEPAIEPDSGITNHNTGTDTDAETPPLGN